MELKDILKAENIRTHVQAKDKNDAIRKMCDVLAENGLVNSSDAFYADVLEREKIGPTCIGNGVAIPHGKSAQAVQPTVVVFKLDEGVMWESVVDEEPADIVILFCVSNDIEAAQDHLRLLAEVARKLAHQDALDALHAADTPDDVLAALL